MNTMFENIDRLKLNTKGRDLICGDIHGCYDLLMSELNKVNFDDTKDRLFCVGDLIDRGPDSLKCAKLVYEPWFFATQGNHERMFFTAFLGRRSRYHSPSDFFRNGGNWSRSENREELKSLAFDMMERMPLTFFVGNKTDGFAVTHARINSQEYDPDFYVWDRSFYDTIQERDSEFMHKWKEEFQQRYFLDKFDTSRRLVYVGHNTLPNGHTIFVDNHLMLDSGAYNFVTGQNMTNSPLGKKDQECCLTIVEHNSFLKSAKS